ncbi:MAG TPA: spore coat U domain-containing protein [Stellaceae bacterium]|nr:spore coat U domain-containing protein [Stellaceae bacterium]
MRRLLALAALVVFLPAAAQAARCTVTATGIAFGIYVPFSSTAGTSAGTISVQCMGLNGIYTIALNAGINGGGNFSNRRMSNGVSYLGYQIYTDAAHTIVWGDGSGGTVTVSATCTPGICSNSYTTYGRIPGTQITATPGSYSDVTTVTVTY